MRKLLGVLAITVVSTLAFAAPAFAWTHGQFNATTDACAGCHVAHAAPAPKLLKAGPTQTEFCYLCHGEGTTSAPYDVQYGKTFSQGTTYPSTAGGFERLWVGPGANDYQTVTSRHTLWGYLPDTINEAGTWDGESRYFSIPGGTSALTGNGLTCGACHDPHAGGKTPDGNGWISGNPRLMRTAILGETVDNVRFKMHNVGASSYGGSTSDVFRVTAYKEGSSAWCGACHNKFNPPSSGEGHAILYLGMWRHPMDAHVLPPPDFDGSLATGTPLEQPGTIGHVACLSCHRAHGTTVQMEGWAADWPRDDGDAGNTSALLRMDDRGLCYNCHGAGQYNCWNDTRLDCAGCHSGGGGGGGAHAAENPGEWCMDCHLDQSHSTHFDTSGKGPGIPENETGCSICHTDSIPDLEAGACDNCHSPGGAFNGVQMAQAAWAEGIYESDGVTLKPGKEKWCSGCHDDMPANSQNDESGVSAPNVSGDNTTYGFYVTGHAINCLNCHDAGKDHIDHTHRTYRAGVTPYSNSYRLRGNAMMIPRPQAPTSGIDPVDFALCLNCHNQDEVLGQNLNQDDKSHTNFWDSMPTVGAINNAHNYHLKDRLIRLDSDWDGVADSRTSCVACHNVHGSPSQVMIRHGELISTPGTTDKVPALNFSYLRAPTGPAATATFTASGLQEGDYQVYAWWVDNTAQYRATDATYTVYHSGGSSEVIVDQTSEGGQWNLLGTYHYHAGATGTVVLDNDYASSGMFVVADAVRWYKVGGGHEVIVDNPNATFVNDLSVWKTYTGDPEGYGADFRYIESHSTPVADPDATLVTSRGGIMNYGGSGLAANKVCKDCHVSSHTRYMRTPKLWPKVIPIPGAVPAVVAKDGSGFTKITVTIYDPDNNVIGVTIDLTAFGGSSTQAMTDNLDGTFSYGFTVPAGTPDSPYVLVVTATDADTNTGKGKVTLQVAEPGAIYLDDKEAVFTGTWSSYSGTTQEYAGGFRYKSAGTGSATAVWTPDIPAAGTYAVYAWWVDNAPAFRATNAPYTTFYDGGSVTVPMDQSTNGPGGGKWNLLGTYTFAAGNSGYVRLSDNANNIVIADAVKFKPQP